MRVDRNAAAIVADREKPIGGDLDLDEMRVAGKRFVHGIIDHLGEQVMQRLLVGPADIHARPPSHGLKPLQHLDVTGGIARFGAAGGLGRADRSGGRPARRRPFEQIAGLPWISAQSFWRFWPCFKSFARISMNEIARTDYATVMAGS